MTELTKYEETLLLEATATGDDVSFTRLYGYYRPKLRIYVGKIVKIPELADDLVQEVFIKLWENRTTLNTVKHFSSYLHTIARNHSLNSLQAISKSSQALPGLIRHFQDHRIDDETLGKDYQLFIEKALASVSPRSREVFRLCREETMSYEQAAVELGISRNAVKKHMVTVIRRLKEAVGKEFGLPMDLLIILLFLFSEKK